MRISACWGATAGLPSNAAHRAQFPLLDKPVVAPDRRTCLGYHEITMSRAASEYRYEKLTWPEINEAVELGKVCVVPVGAVEQHGPHLPLDVDIVCPTEIARGAGRLIPDRMLVLPTVAY